MAQQTLTTHPVALSPPSSQHQYPLLWLLVMSVVIFGLYVAWDRQLFRVVFEIDRSYLSTVIALLFLVSSCHAVWHIVHFSSRIRIVEQYLTGRLEWAYTPSDRPVTADSVEVPAAPGLMTLSAEHYLQSYLLDLDQASTLAQHLKGDDADASSIVEIYADKVRSPVDFGWYLVDLSIRLGLIGTIIGFILIFSSLSTNTIPGADELKELLISMSGGMGTALYTTLTGLVAATFLGLQYLILGRESEHLVGLLIRARNQLLSARFAVANRLQQNTSQGDEPVRPAP